MRKAFLASAIMLLGLGAIPANAMSIEPLPGASSSVTVVAFGCGPGWTRGSWGHCHPMGYAAPMAGPVYGYGYHPYAHPYAYRRCWWRGGVRVCN